MSEPFLGEIKIFPYNFAPPGWAFCSGQVLSIAQNTALFSLLGTTYGGNGQTTFALPDLGGRRAYHPGQGPGLSPVAQGEMTGTETVSLVTGEMPAHTHPVVAVRGGPSSGPTTSPAGATWSNEVKGSPQNTPYTDGQPNTTMSPASMGIAGGGGAHENRPPYLVLSFCIALQGVYPSRN